MNETEALEQAAQEELMSHFCLWTTKHFNGSDKAYMDLVFDNVDEKALLKIAETWYKDTHKRDFYYRKA